MWFLHDGAVGFPSDTVCKKGARRIKNPADDPTSTIHPTLTDHSAGRLPSLSALRQITGTRRRWPSYVLNQISLSLLVTCQTSKPFKAASGACWGGASFCSTKPKYLLTGGEECSDTCWFSLCSLSGGTRVDLFNLRVIFFCQSKSSKPTYLFKNVRSALPNVSFADRHKPTLHQTTDAGAGHPVWARDNRFYFQTSAFTIKWECISDLTFSSLSLIPTPPRCVSKLRCERGPRNLTSLPPSLTRPPCT